MTIHISCGVLAFTASLFEVTVAKECYNRLLADSRFQCEYDCCGEQYKQQCCNFTLQIIGTVIGLVIVLAIIIGVTYYCCRKKSHHGGSTFRALLVRFGISPNPNTTTVTTVNNIRQPGFHHFRGNGHHYGSPQGYGPMPPGYIPLPPRIPPGQHQLYGGAVDPANPTSQPFVSPTAPLPPSYSFEPSHVYFVPKRMPPPPAYDSITHLNPTFKHDDNGSNMPSPSM
ncbi:hypothetical protein CHS0354_030643 [Potamilus streckersoni]|uniref:Uncharacterized protein n=1 Tax=Potamilus streckersoni TaxID=2493646 RepID=A0AAE0VWZ5_9BIVA|nr:hypothetical protein CHS0354_030643 [Potamilus streckersoni]